MIIDYVQKDTSLELSYVGKNGYTKVMELNVSKAPYHHPIWRVTEDNKPNPKYLKYRNWDGKYVELVREKQFNLYDRILFLSKLPQKVRDEIFSYREPEHYTFDIETKIGDKFPEPKDAEQEICSIAFCKDDLHLTTTCYSIDYITQDEANQVNEIVNKYLRHLNNNIQIHTNIVIFDNEMSMMREFVNKDWNKIPCLSGWNSDEFDFVYIINRCRNIGLDIKGASPVGTVDRDGYPTHKIYGDSMNLMKLYDYSIDVVESYGLTWMSNEILGVEKLHYEGTLKEFYERDKMRFLAYNIIDTILVQLIHRAKATIKNIYTIADVSELSLKEAYSPIRQSEAVVMGHIMEKNKALGVPTLEQPHMVVAYNDEPKIVFKYPGGFVKNPVKHHGLYVACFDYSSLYPSLKRTHNICFSNYIKTVMLRDDEVMTRWLDRFIPVLSLRKQRRKPDKDGNLYNDEKMVEFMDGFIAIVYNFCTTKLLIAEMEKYLNKHFPRPINDKYEMYNMKVARAFVKQFLDYKECMELGADPNYSVCAYGGVYCNKKDGILKEVQSGLYVKRKGYQKQFFDIEKYVLEPVKAEIKRRNI